MAPQAYVLVGPTAVGKTSVAHALAVAHGFDVLSCDAMLVYRGMDIGTAKPPLAERRDVRYWGVDYLEPSEAANVRIFREQARAAADAQPDGPCRLILAGGTGLYVKAVTEGLDPTADPDPELRRRWEQVVSREGVAPLQQELRERSPEAYASLADPANPRRLIRALEHVAAHPGPLPRSWRHAAHAPQITGLHMDRPALYARIEERVRAMYRDGLPAETERLLAGGFELAPTARQAIGYAEAIDVLRGRCSRDAAIAQTAQRTRRLAKRQLTWFRHQANVRWINIDPDEPVDQVAARVWQDWRTHGPTTLSI